MGQIMQRWVAVVLVAALWLLVGACGDDSSSTSGSGDGDGDVGPGDGDGDGNPGAASARCQTLCGKAEAACGPDASCLPECSALEGLSCRAAVDAALDCQSQAAGSCDEGDYVVSGCDAETGALLDCALDEGAFDGVGGGDGDGDGGGDGDGDGDMGGGVTSSDLVDTVNAACEPLCARCRGGNDCMNACRVSGVRHPDCLQTYLDLVDCSTDSALCTAVVTSGADVGVVPCAAEIEALRDCWEPVPFDEPLDCLGACDRRRARGCPGDESDETCRMVCNDAAGVPACDVAIATFVTCAAASRDICIPASGRLVSECFAETSDAAGCDAAP